MPRPTQRGFVQGLGVAYLFAFLTAFLLLWLSPPPLPRIALVEQGENTVSLPKLQKAWKEKAQTEQESATPITTGCLLAHSEGHWYLFDESENNLLIVRDQDKNLIMLPLDKDSLEKPCPSEPVPTR